MTQTSATELPVLEDAYRLPCLNTGWEDSENAARIALADLRERVVRDRPTWRCGDDEPPRTATVHDAEGARWQRRRTSGAWRQTTPAPGQARIRATLVWPELLALHGPLTGPVRRNTAAVLDPDYSAGHTRYVRKETAG